MQRHSDLCKSDYVDATCFSQLFKMLPYVPTVSNKSLEAHSFPTELSEHENSANTFNRQQTCWPKIVSQNEEDNSRILNDINRVDESTTEPINLLLKLKLF